MKYFILSYIGKPLGESGESYKTNYKFDYACAECGTGARIEGKLHIKGVKNVSKDFFQTLDGDNIITGKLYVEMINEKLKIGKLNNVVDLNNKVLPLYHFYSEFYFPKADETKGLVIEDQCSVCKMNGYFNEAFIGDIEKGTHTIITPLRLTYYNINSNFLVQSDIFNTWEHMGLSNRNAKGNKIIRYARPLLIVSERLREFLDMKNIANISFEDIEIL